MTNPQVPIQVFSDNANPRLIYVLNFIFSEKGQVYNLNVNNLTDVDDQSLIYGEQPAEFGLHILASGLLTETLISSAWEVQYNGQMNQWTINNIEDDLAVLFYFLSRYEEYIDKGRDEYGRFTARQSVLFKAKQLHQPWCDIIVKRIWEKLGLNTKYLTAQFKTVLSYDIDIAWAYKYKPKWRQIASISKNLLQPKTLKARFDVINEKTKDPYDSYDIIRKNATKFESILFFLVGDYGRLDKNHSWKNKELQNLIQSFSDQAKIGIHPSFGSFLNAKKIITESKRLASITGKKIVNSRKHYLRMSIPESYQLLDRLDITHDYTMGYAEHYGFRAGTAFSFYFFDLTVNKVLTLNITPFTFMDGTLKEYMRLSPEVAIQIISELKENVRAVGGQFIPLWHNHSIGDQNEWTGWRKVYESCLT